MVTLTIAMMLVTFPSPIGAEDWLTLGNQELELKQYESATLAFESALKTGQLNLPGRTYVYWNLFNTTRKVKRLSHKTPEYLFCFIVSAENIEELLTIPKIFMFYKNQGVKEKLRDAKCMLNHYWENRDARIFSGCSK